MVQVTVTAPSPGSSATSVGAGAELPLLKTLPQLASSNPATSRAAELPRRFINGLWLEKGELSHAAVQGCKTRRTGTHQEPITGTGFSLFGASVAQRSLLTNTWGVEGFSTKYV